MEFGMRVRKLFLKQEDKKGKTVRNFTSAPFQCFCSNIFEFLTIFHGDLITSKERFISLMHNLFCRYGLQILEEASVLTVQNLMKYCTTVAQMTTQQRVAQAKNRMKNLQLENPTQLFTLKCKFGRQTNRRKHGVKNVF